MSRKERDRLKVMEQLDQRRISQAKAAQLLRLSPRQVRRVLARWRGGGDKGLVHGLRGRSPHNRISPALKQQAIELICEHYKDYGPTLAAETLAEDYPELAFSRETVRRWMIETHIWQPRTGSGHRKRRDRRDCPGELVQMDTSIHDWFEGRGEAAVLIGMIDDATGRVMLRFYEGDTAMANMDLIRRWIDRHGRPGALYVDFASHFKQPARRGQRRGQHTHTQIQRALGELRITMINAHSPQAKGRVERLFGTLQDRLVKALRRRRIATVETANRYLEEEFTAAFNERFVVAPKIAADAHRSAQGLDLEAILSVQQTRRVGNDLTIHFGGRVYQIEQAPAGNRLARQRVLVEERLDATMRLRHGEQYLSFREIIPVAPAVQAAAAGEAAALAGAGAPVGLRPPSAPTPARPKTKRTPSKDHPWKKRTFLLCKK